MTPPAVPGREPMPRWAKRTLFGCGGCLVATIVLAIAGVAAFWQLVGRNMELLDVSDKQDPPLGAAAAQLLPARVGPFVRMRITRPSQQVWGDAAMHGWRGVYFAGNRRVDMVAITTAAAQQANGDQPMFGAAMSMTQPDPKRGYHIIRKRSGETMEIVYWIKPRWTVMFQSAQQAAKEFALAYQPVVGSER